MRVRSVDSELEWHLGVLCSLAEEVNSPQFVLDSNTHYITHYKFDFYD